MEWSGYCLWSGVPDLITHAKFYVNRLRGFSAAAPRKRPFPILFWTTLTTVLHYRADCDDSVLHSAFPTFTYALLIWIQHARRIMYLQKRKTELQRLNWWNCSTKQLNATTLRIHFINWFLFNTTLTNYGMRHQTYCRRRTTNAAVAVTTVIVRITSSKFIKTGIQVLELIIK